MASRFGITESDVRLLVGVGTSAINDADMVTFIEKAEFEAENHLKTKFGNNEFTQHLTSLDGSNIARLSHTPVNRIIEVTIGGTAITPKYLKFDGKSGRVIITDTAEKTEWDDTSEKSNFVKYDFGRLERSTLATTLSEIGTAGQTLLHVGTGTGIHVNDYVLVVGTGTGSTIGHEEILTVTGTAHNLLTVDKKQYEHKKGADVIKMVIPNLAKQLSECIAALMAASYMVGNTYTFATSYNIPELGVTKGVPYPHFERMVMTLLKRRDMLLSQYRPELAIA